MLLPSRGVLSIVVGGTSGFQAPRLPIAISYSCFANSLADPSRCEDQHWPRATGYHTAGHVNVDRILTIHASSEKRWKESAESHNAVWVGTYLSVP
jgi:hypothetical protein